MQKRIIALILCLLTLAMLTGCKEEKILHCDHCGDEVVVEADSNMEEDWIIFCGPCNEELFAENPVVDPG